MSSIDTLSVNALRVVGAKIITKAKSGHPGIVLGSAPILHTLFTRFININPEDDKWFDRDRFILSAGHGSCLLYELLSLSGFGLSIDDLYNFRQKGSITPGHPEYGHTKGVEITTGPLGQGIATSVGMAIAENHMASKFNKSDIKIINHYTYVLCGDGDLQEGITQEAISLAGHLGLNKLIVLYDSNDVQLDGDVNLANTENIKDKVEAMGWNHILVKDGNDCDAIAEAIKEAQKSETKPTMIEIKTIIGYGAPNSGESSVHGKPMPEEDIVKLIKNLEYPYGDMDDFPSEVKEFYMTNVKERGYKVCSLWNEKVNQYRISYKEDYKDLEKFMYDGYSLNELDGIPTWDKTMQPATRDVCGKVLDYLSAKLPNIMGGSADLTASTKVKGADGIYGQSNPLGRNIKFGVREHAMAAIANGITLHGGMRGFCSGFFVFSDYLKPAVRLAAIMHLPTVFMFSHDTVCVGEDGPTHQPIEQLTMFRSMPNTNVIRPADAKEMSAAMVYAFKNKKEPVIITSTRQGLPTLDNTKEEGLEKGGYIVYKPSKKATYTIVAAGSEVALAIDAAKKLEEDGIYATVVSMPSFYLFDLQSEDYKKSIIPDKSKTFALEMGSTLSWYKYANVVKGIDTFGSSMPLKYIFDYYGFNVDGVVADFKKGFNL
jgi:transketolase